MRLFQLVALAFSGALVSSCATIATMNSPAEAAKIVAAPNGPDQVYWTFETSLPTREEDWKAHVERWERARPLPASLRASAGQYLWIVPVCNGSTRWDKASLHQIIPGEMTARVSC